MRLIDADNVKELISEELDKHFNRWDNTITVAEMETLTRDAIDKTPTIAKDYHTGYQDGLEDGLNDIKPQGKWIWVTKSTNIQIEPNRLRCSNCNFMFNNATPHCPNCGADMRCVIYERN